jgi:hypothetical protein
MRQAPLQFRWTRASTVLMSGFLLVVSLIIYVWWPLAREYLAYIDWQGPWWLYMDWLLIGVFLFMSLAIAARADLRTDGMIILVGTLGGLAIESWGTQTNIWSYYTSERPPLWIVPAWPIASLSIDRIAHLLDWLADRALQWKAGSPMGIPGRFPLVPLLYWLTFAIFFGLMLAFVAPASDKPYTILAILMCALLILTPTDQRFALLTFAAGTSLGYFLELWGTTRQCWTYYTLETPPLFAVLAHGMAAVAFWRTGLLIRGLPRIFLPHRSYREQRRHAGRFAP